MDDQLGQGSSAEYEVKGGPALVVRQIGSKSPQKGGIAIEWSVAGIFSGEANAQVL
jgi:hypothetical protein